jgi:hypothetical protein
MSWAEIDMTRPVTRGPREPGVYPVRVASAESRTSRAGNKMLSLELVDLETGRFVLRDYVLLSGDAWRYGRMKLLALGIDEGFRGDLDDSTLVGRVAFVATKQVEFNGTQRLEPDVAMGGAGYFRPDEPPPGFEPIEATRESAPEPGDEDRVPF